jgi:hypothetical protein
MTQRHENLSVCDPPEHDTAGFRTTGAHTSLRHERHVRIGTRKPKAPGTSWLESFFRNLGPGLVPGITIGDWFRLLAENRFRVELPFWGKAACTTFSSCVNTPFRWVEEAVYSRRVAAQTVLPPIFILGHWRSGTTHLHNLLSLDSRFAYPKFAQAMIPNSFLTGERPFSLGCAVLLPSNRYGVDEMTMYAAAPWEEEFGLCVATFLSPYLSWAFPSRTEHYDRYLTFRGVPAHEIERWKSAILTLLKKLTLRLKRPLVLKSPPNTARIRLLLELFPDARFIHIHRNPYSVYQSTLHLHRKLSVYFRFQRQDLAALHGRVIRQYAEMHDAFFEERPLIPKGRFAEVAYQDLDADPVGQVRRIYDELDLPDFAEVEPALNEYLGSIADYKKNKHVELTSDVRSEIARAWRRSFDTWKYPL